MTPNEAYTGIRDRARFMLQIYDGLLNTRQRRIRQDWKEGFCDLMHWRQDIPIERLDTPDAVIILKENSRLTTEAFTHNLLDDFLRSSLVMAVGALDRYVHERVVRLVVKSFRSRDLNREQETLAIPASIALKISDEMVRLRRNQPQHSFRPANIVRKNLQEHLHTRPFQSWKEITYAFALIGINGLDGRLQAAYGVHNLRNVKREHSTIIAKRNHIVHEGDIVKHQRAGHAHIRKNPISRQFVDSSITFLDTLVRHLETIT